MKAIVLGLILTLTGTLSGCSTITGFFKGDPAEDNSQPDYYQPTPTKKIADDGQDDDTQGFWGSLFSFGSDDQNETKQEQPKQVKVEPINQPTPITVKHTLADYVAGMAQQMINSARYVSPSTPIGVASFVSINDLKETSVFGMQLAESFVYEMQQHGMSVIDYKATGFIRITKDGDFVYSRNIKELAKAQPIQYLLIGTYTRTIRGYMINARLVGAESKVVVASAQQLVPTQIYNDAMDIDPNRDKPRMKDGIVLIKSN